MSGWWGVWVFFRFIYMWAMIWHSPATEVQVGHLYCVCDWLVAPCCDWLWPANIMESATFLSSHLVTVFSIRSIRHDEFLGQDRRVLGRQAWMDDRLRTPMSKRSRWGTEPLKRAEPSWCHWLGHNKLAALARKRPAYQEQLAIGRRAAGVQRRQPESEGDGETRERT